MNILAEEQKKIFEQNLTEEEYKKRMEQFLELYYQTRAKTESRFYSKMTLEQRKKLHKVILGIYRIKNKLGGFSYEVIKDERQQTERPIIFVLTHVGKFDIEVTSAALKDHYYLLSGDYEHIQGIIDEPFIGMNGIFYFNEFVKEDRIAVTEKMHNHLKQMGNLMYFIEGTWNMTPNLPVLPCYWGVVDVAKKGNAVIIPVAMDQYGEHFKINIGNNFDMAQYGEGVEEKARAITDLRDTLATLKWEIWETEYTKREELDGMEWEQYIEARFKEWPYFNEKYIARLVYKPKNVVQHDDVYGPVKKLVPTKENAFLYNKRLKDDIFR